MTHPICYVRPSQIDPAQWRLYQRAIWIAVLGNVTLVPAKGAVAWLSGSTALLATAVDSASDLVYTLFMAWDLSRSQQPADESHPHVEVDGNITFHDAHRISNAARDAVVALDEVDLAFVHLEPVQPHSGRLP